MTYTDHAAEARQHIKRACEVQEEEGRTDRSATDLALIAQAHATLAVAEQLRIANEHLGEVVRHVTRADN